MANLNRWEGIGRLGADLEVRYLPNGDAVTSFSIACDDSYKDKETNQKVERVEWVRCVAFRQTAEFLGEWLNKGARLYAVGKLKTREYEKDGVKRYVTEIHLGQGTEIIDWPERDSQQTRQQQSRPASNQQSRQQQPSHQQSRQQQAPQQSQQGTNGPDAWEDDIPF